MSNERRILDNVKNLTTGNPSMIDGEEVESVIQDLFGLIREKNDEIATLKQLLANVDIFKKNVMEIAENSVGNTILDASRYALEATRLYKKLRDDNTLPNTET